MLSLSSPEWQEILRDGLGADVDVVEGREPTVCATFNVGPLRVCYPGFPVGADSELARDALAVAKKRGAAIVRFTSPHLPPDSARAVLRLDTHRIADLHAWNERPPAKAKRARNRSGRQRLIIERAQHSDGTRLHALYAETMMRNGSPVRYGVEYFRLTAPHSCLVARCNGRVCGFVSFAGLGARAYYLHGAHDPGLRHLYISDQLFEAMISTAATTGFTEFDFLPSPPGQPGVSAYKAAWGGAPATLHSWDVDLLPNRAMLLRAATRLARWAPRLASRALAWTSGSRSSA